MTFSFRKNEIKITKNAKIEIYRNKRLTKSKNSTLRSISEIYIFTLSKALDIF